MITSLTPLDPTKRSIALERIAAHLQHGVSRPTDADIARALQVTLTGLVLDSAAA